MEKYFVHNIFIFSQFTLHSQFSIAHTHNNTTQDWLASVESIYLLLVLKV